MAGTAVQLRINHQAVVVFANVHGNPGQRPFPTFTYQHPTPVTAAQVEVAFMNDATGSSILYVDKIEIDGVPYESEGHETFSTGTYSSGTGCDAGYKQSEILNCDGYFRYGVVVQRSTYMLAGQAVTVRVTGDPDSANNGRFYLYSDHLGSASAMQKDDSSTPIITRYTPFGGYRTGSGPNEVADRGFTGHKHNDSLGLVYMNARYKVSGIGRFASADSVVPDPANPQQYNRYTYSLNNPLRYTDPSGHCVNNYEAGSDDMNTCISAWNAIMNYYTHIIYGPRGDGEWSEGLSIGTNEWLMNADIATLESLMEAYGIDYGYTSDLPVPGLDDLHDTGCVWVGGSQACPPEGGWPKYYPWTEEDTEWVVDQGVKAVLHILLGKLTGNMIGKIIKDPVEKILISQIVGHVLVNPIADAAYESYKKEKSDLPTSLTTDLGPTVQQPERPAWMPKPILWDLADTTE